MQRNIIPGAVMALIVLCPTLLFAQVQKITILNDKKQPLAYAHYHYGDQNGHADESGEIQIQFVDGQQLLISHIELGQQTIASDKVKQALENGTLQLDEGNPLILQPVSILAKRNDKALSMEVDQQDRLSHDAGDFLSQLPGVAVIRKSGNYGFDPVLRGFKYDQLNLVIDGVQSANAACPNRMDPPASQVPMHRIAKVEVLKGPYALRYGPSFGGTLNFLETDPEFSLQKQWDARISSSYESNGDILRNEGMLGWQSADWQLELNGSWSEGNDYLDGEGNSVAAQFNRGSFGARLARKLTDNQTLDISATRNLARDVDFTGLPMDLVSDDTWLLRAHHAITLERSRLTSINTSVYATLVEHVMDNLNKKLNPRMVNAVTDVSTRTYGGRSEAQFSLPFGFAFAGIDLKVEEAFGFRTRDMLMGPMAGKSLKDNVWQHGRITRTGIFTEYHLQKGKSQYVFAGRVDYNQANTLDEAEEFSQNYADNQETDLNFSLSAGSNFDLNNFTLGLWLGRGQRSAGITERFINFFPVGLDPFELIGNPALKPESNNQVDLKIGYQEKGTSMDLNLFASYLQDYISSEVRPEISPRLPGSPGVRQFVNIDEAVLAGFEFTWSQKLFKPIIQNVSLIYTYGQDLVRDDPLPEILPMEFRYEVKGYFVQDKLFAGINFRHVWKQERVSEIFAEKTTDGFTLADINLHYQLSNSFKFSVGIENIWDEYYTEHLNRAVRGTGERIYLPGRNFFTTFTYNL